MRENMRNVGKLLICLALLYGGVIHAAYKCVSPEGKVSFQDLPCEKNSTSKSLATERPAGSAITAKRVDFKSSISDDATMEPKAANTTCSSAQMKWTMTLSMLDYLAGQISDAQKRAQALDVVAQERRLNRDFNGDRCAEKYLTNPAYAKRVECIAGSVTTRETAACRGLTLPSDAGQFVAPNDGALWTAK
jgi:hypothetical protein